MESSEIETFSIWRTTERPTRHADGRRQDISGSWTDGVESLSKHEMGLFDQPQHRLLQARTVDMSEAGFVLN